MKFYKEPLTGTYANYYAVKTYESGMSCLVVKNHMLGYDIQTTWFMPDGLSEISADQFKLHYDLARYSFDRWKL